MSRLAIERRLPQKLRGRLLTALAAGPASAATAVKALAAQLDGADAAILLDMAAARMAPVKGARRAAAECHAAARALERKLGLERDLDAAITFAAALAVTGAAFARELMHLARAAHAAGRGDLAPALATAAVDAVVHGEEPRGDLLRVLADLDAAQAAIALRGWLAKARARLAAADHTFWSDATAAMVALIAVDAEAAAWAIGFVPSAQASRTWLALVAAADLASRVAPADARGFAWRQIALAVLCRADAHALELLARMLPPLVPVLRARGEALPVLRDQPDRYEHARGLLPPALLELLLALEAPLGLEPDVERAPIDLYHWAQQPADAAYHHLERLAAVPRLLARVDAGVLASLENIELASIVARVAASGVRAALDGVAALVERIAARGSVGTFQWFKDVLGRICQPVVLTACPRLVAAVRALRSDRLLQHQLRAGVLDEWGWPALDAAADEVGHGYARHQPGGSFPYLVLRDDDRVRVVGPDAIVLDHRDPIIATDFTWMRQGAYVDGDVLLVSGTYQGRWLRAGIDLGRTGLGVMFDPLDGGGPVGLDGTRLVRGGPPLPHVPAMGGWCDREAMYQPRHGHPCLRVGLDGRALEPGLPRWMTAHAEASGGAIDLSDGFVLPVPTGATASPLGAAGGVGGLAVWKDAAGIPHAAGIDGRRFDGEVGHGWTAIVAVMTFPERAAIYPVARGHGGTWAYSADGDLPLIATDDDHAADFRAGAPVPLGLPWWHLMRPRDPEGSRTLAACTLEQAAALLAIPAATPAVGEPAEELPGYDGLRVIMQPAPVAAASPDRAALEVVALLLPGVSHPRLLAGVVGIARLAAVVAGDLADLQGRVDAALGGQQATLRNRDVVLLDPFFHADFRRPGRWGQDRLGQQLHDVAAFLASPMPGVRTPAACFVPWERALIHGRELLLLLLGAATPPAVRAQVRGFLELFRATALAELPLALGVVTMPPPFAGIDHDHLDRLIGWDRGYFLRCTQLGGPGQDFGFAALTVGDAFVAPTGATVTELVALDDRLEAAAIDQALALLDARGPMPLDAGAARALAEATGLLVETAALLLNGCHLHAPADPAALGIAEAHLAAARAELAIPTLHAVVAAAVPRDLSTLYAPGVLAENLAARWPGNRRPRLALELVERLTADVRHPHPPFDQAARALQDPDGVPALTRDATWVVRPFSHYNPSALSFGSVPNGWPERSDAAPVTWARRWPHEPDASSYDLLPSWLKYLAWAYLELPGGNPLRLGASRLAALLAARLAAPGMLVPLGLGDLRDVDALLAWLAPGRPYRAVDGGPSAAGVERDGIVVAWPGEDAQPRDGVMVMARPCALTDQALAEVAALPGVTMIALDYRALLERWRSPDFQALVASLGGGTGYVADPRVSAPDAVAAVRRRLQLDEDAATLWLQLRWLAEPTAARVARYNRWSLEQHDAAAAALVARGLAVRTLHPGSARVLYLPGPVATLDRCPGAIELGKLEAHGLVAGRRPPLAAPLPVQPIEHLYCRES